MSTGLGRLTAKIATSPQRQRKWIEMTTRAPRSGALRLVGLPTVYVEDDVAEYRDVTAQPWADDF
jgi:hypothetical protein